MKKRMMASLGIVIVFVAGVFAASGISEFLITTDTDDQLNPAIYSNIVVYEDYGDGNYDLCYDCHGPRRDTNKPMMPRAINTIKNARELLSKAEGLCEGLKEKEDPTFDECCSEEKFNEAKELLEMAEKFFIGGNYIAANNFALKAILKLEEIIECCEG
ncbi:MAG: hypothetical protein ACE5HW_04390 [Candidatus Methanofastidiosia archaeon]